MEDNTKINIDDSAITWKEYTSDKGKKYEVGYLSDEEFSTSKNIESNTIISFDNQLLGRSGKRNFGVTVNWPVGNSHWKNTVSHVEEQSSITKYSLYEYKGFWKYKLYFKNTKHYKFTFYDETGDGYTVDTFRNGSHYVRFDSKKPRIVYIAGS